MGTPTVYQTVPNSPDPLLCLPISVVFSLHLFHLSADLQADHSLVSTPLYFISPSRIEMTLMGGLFPAKLNASCTYWPA